MHRAHAVLEVHKLSALSDSQRFRRGGVRVIYYHITAQAQVRLLLIYRKGVKDDLTAAEKKTLRKLNQDW